MRGQVKHEDPVMFATLDDGGHGRAGAIAHLRLPLIAQAVGRKIFGARVSKAARDLARHNLYAIDGRVGGR
jgi:hypothetical protein